MNENDVFSMITAAERKLLLAFARTPHESFSVNEASRRAKVAVSRVHALLRQWEREGLFTKKRVSNSTLYLPNLSNEKTRKIMELLTIDRREAFLKKNVKIRLLLTDFKEEWGDKREYFPETIVLFGSVARGSIESSKDVDLILITSHHKKVLDNVERINPRIRRLHDGLDLHPLIMSENEFKENLRNRNDTIIAIMNEGLVVRGVDKYWKMIMESVTE